MNREFHDRVLASCYQFGLRAWGDDWQVLRVADSPTSRSEKILEGERKSVFRVFRGIRSFRKVHRNLGTRAVWHDERRSHSTTSVQFSCLSSVHLLSDNMLLGYRTLQ
jgi:hypothetical protein